MLNQNKYSCLTKSNEVMSHSSAYKTEKLRHKQEQKLVETLATLLAQRSVRLSPDFFPLLSCLKRIKNSLFAVSAANNRRNMSIGTPTCASLHFQTQSAKVPTCMFLQHSSRKMSMSRAPFFSYMSYSYNTIPILQWMMIFLHSWKI